MAASASSMPACSGESWQPPAPPMAASDSWACWPRISRQRFSCSWLSVAGISSVGCGQKHRNDRRKESLFFYTRRLEPPHVGCYPSNEIVRASQVLEIEVGQLVQLLLLRFGQFLAQHLAD